MSESCTIEGCNRCDKIVRGLCAKHYQTMRYHADRGACGVFGCTHNVYSRKLCNLHYIYARKGGKLDLIELIIENPLCPKLHG